MVSAANWTRPLRGQYSLGPRFGETGPHWETYHTGQDFRAPRGTFVYAVAPGFVVDIDTNHPAYGKLVKVRHSGGVESWYAHLNSITVTIGTLVKAGTLLGMVGETGNTTGPHLHLEARDANGKPFDPMPLFTGEAPPETPGTPPGDGGTPTVPDMLITDPGAWLRVAYFIGGAGLLIFGLWMLRKQGYKL